MKSSRLKYKSKRLGQSIVLCAALFLLVFFSGAGWSQGGVVGSGLKQPIIRYDSIHHPVKGRFGMVVSQNSIASSVGQGILAGFAILFCAMILDRIVQGARR